MPMRYLKQHPALSVMLIAITVLVCVACFIPWQHLAKIQLLSALKQHGFVNADMAITQLDFSSAQLETLRLAKDAPVIFEKLNVRFSPLDILTGRLERLDINGLTMELQQGKTGWSLNGAPLLLQQEAKPGIKPVLPVTAEELTVFPLDSATLVNSILRVTTDSWNTQAPLEIKFKKFPEVLAELSSHDIVLKASGITLSAARFHSKIELDPGDATWKGAWQAEGIAAKGQDNLLPILNGSGTITANANTIIAEVKLESADHQAHATFALSYPLGAPEKAQLRLISAAIPWNKGMISLRETAIPLNGRDALQLTLYVDHIPVDALMMLLTGKQTTATGDVSGSIPVILKPDGQIQIGQGKLQAEKPGVIALSPDVIPGDNEQIALVRDVMKNLHYTLLSIGMDSGADHQLSIHLAVEGTNPDMAESRPVKLNVHLTGDLLSLAQQSLLSLTDPHMFLKQGAHAK